MEDQEILECIRGLVAEEHWLRDQRDRGLLSEDVEVRRLEQLEENLDQLWDTLRRRRAMRAAGLDPDAVEQRPSLQVQSYVQ
ncbi:MAG: DUF2630 family protein [Kineosporiaceae bacterium]|jgi:hypothetical protein